VVIAVTVAQIVAIVVTAASVLSAESIINIQINRKLRRRIMSRKTSATL
jgi:hypothetical protein